MELGPNFTLVQRYMQCDADWTAAVLRGEYKINAATPSDCDNQRYGLKWEVKTVELDLARVEPGSIRPVKPLQEQGVYSLSFGMEGDEYGTYDIACPDQPTCNQMAADLKQLAQLAHVARAASPTATASRSTPEPMSQSTPQAAPVKTYQSPFPRMRDPRREAAERSHSAPPQQRGSSAPPAPRGRGAVNTTNDSVSSRVASLMARINEAFQGAYWGGFELGSAFRGESVTLDKSMVLTFHTSYCEAEKGFPYGNFAEGGARLVRECDQGLNGLKWQLGGKNEVLLLRAESPFEVSIVRPDDDGQTRKVTIYRIERANSPNENSWEVTSPVGCKNRQSCERMAKDLQELLDILSDVIATARARKQ